MVVHVKHPDSGMSYNSVVYAVIHFARVMRPDVPPQLQPSFDEELIVYDPHGKVFRLVPRFLRTCTTVAGIETTLTSYACVYVNRSAEGFVPADGETRTLLSESCGRQILRASGYPEAMKNPPFLKRILAEDAVSVDAAGFSPRIPAISSEWTYVTTQNDADALLETAHDFHDQKIMNLQYEWDGSDLPSILVRIGRDGACRFLLFFEGVRDVSVHNRPEWADCIGFASLRVGDGGVFWSDSAEDEPDGETTYIRAATLKWREEELH